MAYDCSVAAPGFMKPDRIAAYRVAGNVLAAFRVMLASATIHVARSMSQAVPPIFAR